MNLLLDKWIPVKGSAKPVAPWEITANNCTVQAVKSIRPDFDAALLFFLIGLYQFAFFEADEDAWVNRFFHPPAPDEIRTRFLGLEIRNAFELLGEGNRFMQEPPRSLPSDSPVISIAHLLIDYPPRKKIEDGNDHFEKHHSGRRMCLPCCATALYAMQSFTAYGGGHGAYRSSIHNGTPVTTFLIGKNLWQTVWLNVLSAETASNRIPTEHVDKPEVFPWLQSSLDKWIGEDKAAHYFNADRPEDFFHVYWAMPRRVRFGDLEDGVCFVCGEHAQTVGNCQIGTFGINYKRYWPHPLVPSLLTRPEQQDHLEDAEKIDDGDVKDSNMLDTSSWISSGSLIGQRIEGYSHLDWLGLALADWSRDKNTIRPARVVSTYLGRRADEICGSTLFSKPQNIDILSLWAAGYVYDTNKQLCHQFINSRVPLVVVKGEEELMQAIFERAVRGISEDAKVILTALIKKLREIVGGELDDKRKKVARADAAREVTKLFAARTELAFFQLITRAAEDPVGYGADWKTHVARCGEGGWREYLARQAVMLFDSFVDIMQMSNPADIVKAIKARSVIDKLRIIKQPGKKGKHAVGDTTGRKHDKRK